MINHYFRPKWTRYLPYNNDFSQIPLNLNFIFTNLLHSLYSFYSYYIWYIIEYTRLV